MTDDITALRAALAAGPTPGPWTVLNHSWSDTTILAAGFDHGICGLDINHATEDSQEADEALMAANANHIATASPDRIGRVLDALEAAQAECARLRAELAKAERRAIGYSDVIANHCIAMQAALIDQSHAGPMAGMRWISNTLFGPGLYPDIGEALALSKTNPAQAWFDAKTAEHEAFRAAHPGPDAALATKETT